MTTFNTYLNLTCRLYALGSGNGAYGIDRSIAGNSGLGIQLGDRG